MAGTEKLLAGFKRFKQNYFGDNKHLYASMKHGQPAKTLMIACCDSRVDPAILTDCDPGDLFIVRNVANLIPPCEDDGFHHGTSSAIEFAVVNLEVENIIIMGHSNCGGIKALWENENINDAHFIHSWVAIAESAKVWVKSKLQHASHPEQIKACEQRALLESLANLMTFSFVKEAVEEGRLTIHGWYFDINAGDMLGYNSRTGAFESLMQE